MRQPNLDEVAAYYDATGNMPPKAYIIETKYLPNFFVGWTIFNRILVKDETRIDVICHELRHVEQFNNDPWLFHIKYFWQLVTKGYDNNPYEIDAFNVERKVNEQN